MAFCKRVRVEIKPDRRFIKAKRGFSLRSGIQFSSADAATLLWSLSPQNYIPGLVDVWSIVQVKPYQVLISRIYDFSKSGLALPPLLLLRSGKITLLYVIWSWKIPLVILWYSGQEWSDRGSTIAMKEGRRPAFAGEYEIATWLIDLHEHGWLHLIFHFWLRTLWTRSPHDMTERCHQARKSIDLRLPKEMESGINFSFYLESRIEKALTLQVLLPSASQSARLQAITETDQDRG